MTVTDNPSSEYRKMLYRNNKKTLKGSEKCSSTSGPAGNCDFWCLLCVCGVVFLQKTDKNLRRLGMCRFLSDWCNADFRELITAALTTGVTAWEK